MSQNPPTSSSGTRSPGAALLTLIAILAVLMVFVVLLLRLEVAPAVTIGLLTATCTSAAGLVKLVFSRGGNNAAPPGPLRPDDTHDAGSEG